MQQAVPLTAQQVIQAILSPGLMISATGLLLLGLNNRYQTVANRLRLLNDEKRRSTRKQTDQSDFDYLENIRLESITRQINSLFHRSGILRRAILFKLVGIGFYLITSLIIGSNFIFSSDFIRALPIATFVIGLCCSFVGVIFAIVEISSAYAVLQLEVRAD